MDHPDDFLNVHVHDADNWPGCSGLCVGYERGQWRSSQFADHVMEWLPEFALSVVECEKMTHANAVRFMRRAAKAVYDSKKFKNRGEFGELFLHIAICQLFNSIPAISKIYYKSATNDTVKGFDAVHVVGQASDLELWIGEAKFYDNIGRAVYDVVNEIKSHTTTDYLRSEFALIANKIDGSWEHAEALKRLLDPTTSLDDVFARACIPVLLTYDSPAVGAYTECNAKYVAAFQKEVRENWNLFASKDLPKEVRIHLFLMPMKAKKELIAALDERLKSWQAH